MKRVEIVWRDAVSSLEAIPLDAKFETILRYTIGYVMAEDHDGMLVCQTWDAHSEQGREAPIRIGWGMIDSIMSLESAGTRRFETVVQEKGEAK